MSTSSAKILILIAATLAAAACTSRSKKAIEVTPQTAREGQEPPASEFPPASEQPPSSEPPSDSNPGAGQGSDPGAGQGSDPGTGSSNDPGNQPGANPGSSNPGSSNPGGPGTQPGSDPQPPGTQPGSQPGGSGDASVTVTLEVDDLNAALDPNTGGSTGQPPASTSDTTLTADITVETGGSVGLNDLNVKPPQGWGIAQKGAVGTAVFTAVANGTKYVSIYSVPEKNLTLDKIFGHGAQVVTPETSKSVGSNTWKVIETKKTVSSGPHKGTWFVYGFMMEKGAFTYYGYARAESAEQARSQALEVLESL